MIITNIIGGLGNQMFQYAAGLALAKKHQTDYKLDTVYFKNYTLHNGFELNRVFSITAEVATSHHLNNALGMSGIHVVRRILRRPAFAKFRKANHIVEPHHGYWSGFNNLPNNVYLDGYWQSEAYFKDVADLVRKEFSFCAEPNELNQTVIEQINHCNSVSLHIRRGDYVSDSKNAFIGVCALDYYKSAVLYIKSLTANPIFFVFSDDIAWAKSNLDLDQSTVFVSHNKGVDSYNDMRLMSHCKHHIIANSTFSWWGAWLNANPSKVVVAPKQWFANGQDDSDLIPDSWVRV